MEAKIELAPKIFKRIRRLEIAVVTLGILFIASLSVSVYCAVQLETLVKKIPSYNELKEDVRKINDIYELSEDKLPKAIETTKEVGGVVYDSALVKATNLIEYLKSKRK